ncbi:MAG: hypothetical protein WBD79_26275 [Anaerolineae bacterium]
MADPVDRLFQEWQQLGGQVLLAEVHVARFRPDWAQRIEYFLQEQGWQTQ